MEESKEFQDSMQANYPCVYQYSSQPMGPYQPFQGEQLSQPMGPNQPFQGEPLTQPMGQNQPCQNQPFQGEPSYNIDEPIHVLGNRSHGNCLNWPDEIARLLITAISYVAEAASSDVKDDACSRRMKLISKMTMWNVVSTVLSERGFNVSPQQCEEKFREINNKYKQMISLLGRETSCNVVENPILLDSINMPENKKEEARMLLHSEQFLYREMCSFHHGNRMFLPHDWEIRRFVFLNHAKNYDDYLKNQQRNYNETGQNQHGSTFSSPRWIEMEEKRLEIQEQRLQLEKARFQWLCFNRDEDLKLEKFKLENETMKLENAKMAFELKRRQNSSVDEN